MTALKLSNRRGQKMSNRGRQGKRQDGQSMTEFVIVTPVMLLLVLGAIQFSFIYEAKTTLAYATFQAARSGALNYADPTEMAYSLVGYMAANYAAKPDPASVRQARACLIDEFNLGMIDLQILNPTSAEYGAFGIDLDGEIAIPNDNLMYRSPDGGVPIQDANLLKIRVTYCQKLIVPFIDRTLITLLTVASQADTTPHFTDTLPSQAGPESSDVFAVGDIRRSCLVDHGRLPITAEATIRMHTPPVDLDNDISLEKPLTSTCNRDL